MFGTSKLWQNILSKNKICARGVSNQLRISSISPLYIKEKLMKEKVDFSDGYTCFKISQCSLCGPICKKTVSSRSIEMYINKHTGFFVCELCRSMGSWDVFEKLFDRRKQPEEPSLKEVINLKESTVLYYEKGQSSWKKLLNSSTPLHESARCEEILREFNLLAVPNQIIEKLGVYLSEDQALLYFPIFSSSQLVGFMALNKAAESATYPKKNCAGFLLFAPKRKMSSAVIVSNIPDLFALLASNINSHLVCLPYGISSLPQTILPFLEAYDSLTLWLGSWDATKAFSKKLNEKRCFFVSGVDSAWSPSEAVRKGLDVQRILREAPATWHQSITTFSSLRNDVLLELKNHKEILGVQWKRFPALNRILKGHRRGELTVLTGPTGSGKTTFMSEYSLDLASQGVNTLWGSFEVRNVRLAKTMLQQYVGQPLEKNLTHFEDVADEFERLPIYFLTFHGQQSIKAVMDVVKHASYIYDIAHVIIDNVQFMLGMSEEPKVMDRFYKQDLLIHNFRTFATKSNCHVTLVIHPRKEKDTEDLTISSIFGGAKAVQEADNVLIIQDKRLVSVKGKKYLQVTKNRYTGDLGVMPLDFDKDSLSFKVATKKKEVEAT